MVTTTSDNLIVNGSLQNMNENMVIEFSNLNDKDNKVAIGDPVVTSYVSNRYQQGILIGYISTLTMDSNNLTKSGTITPAVDFEHIEEVLVILNKKQTAESLEIEVIYEKKDYRIYYYWRLLSVANDIF